MRYKIFYRNKEVFLVIPIEISFKVLIGMLNCMPSFTLKRKVYKLYVFLVMFFWITLFRFIISPKKNKGNEIILDEILKFNKKNETLFLVPMIIWSLVPGRKRYYIHFFDKNGEKKFFGKLTTNNSDFILLQKEYDYLKEFHLKKKIDVSYITPKVIYSEIQLNSFFLVVETIPKGFKLFHPSNFNFPEKLWVQINGDIKNVKIKEIKEKKWWNSIVNNCKNTQNLHSYITNLSDDFTIEVSNIHGDFGSENILINDQNEFMVIDWERSTKFAPFLTDKVAFWMGKNHLKIKSNTKDIAKLFHEKFHDENKIDLLLAIAFLVSANFDLAIILAKKIDY